MLAERERELALIEEALSHARESAGSTLALCGEPGIGKSELLKAASAAWPSTLLKARGVELEAELPFVGLRDLLAPIREGIADLPDPQRRALLGALAVEAGDPVEQFAVCVGTLTLLAAAAEQAPLLVVVDDLQWIDVASRAVIRFVARRVTDDPIAMIFAARDVVEGFDDETCRVHTVPRLTTDGVRRMIQQHSGSASASALAVGLHEATAGNPLAVSELLRRGEARLVEAPELRQPLPVSDLIARAFRERLARISSDAQTALLVASATNQSNLTVLVGAAGRLGSGLSGFTEAEAAGLVSLDHRLLTFSHPLIRSVVYGRADAQAKRNAHRVLAEQIAGQGDLGEEAWHLASASVLPDERIASRLAAAAERYQRRSGHYATARALVRAAELTPEDHARARRLHDAAEAARRSGHGELARQLLDRALQNTLDDRLRLEIEFTRAILLAWSEPARGTSQRYEDIGSRAAAIDSEIAATAYSYAAAQSVVEGDITGARRRSERAAAVASRNRVSNAVKGVALQAWGVARVLGGERTGAETLRQVAHDMLASGEATGREYLALPLIWTEDYDLAWRLLGSRLDDARQQGDLRALTASLEVQATLCYRTGSWTRAQEAAAESVRLAEESNQTVQLAYSLATLAIIQAGQGNDRAHDCAKRAGRLGEQLSLTELDQYVRTAVGLLELGRGDLRAALDALIEAQNYDREAGQAEPCVHQWAADLIDAATLTKKVEIVRATIDQLLKHESRPWAQAVAWRGVGMLASGDDYEAAFDQAFNWHARTIAPFECARAHLWLGRRLRRDRRRVDARAHLNIALQSFDQLGSGPWIEAARRELAASGERLRRSADARDLLTPQESQMISLLAEGGTNKDIAGNMYLSPKTVETHLSRIYRKLGVRSRQELLIRVLEDGQREVA